MGILGSSVRSLMHVTWSPARTTAPVLTSGREMKDKTTAVPASQVCERVCVSVILRNCAERWRTKLQLYLPARCVSVYERVCVFQSFSETVQRDDGQNYSCTCQPGVWACVCFSHSQKLCREMTDKTTAVPASQVCERVWACVCVSVILRNCAERWRTKLQLYLPARCVSVCVFQSFSETVQRDDGQNYSCTCQPGVWACVCVSVILRNCAERWRTKLQLYLPARCVSVCVCFSHSQKLCREMMDKTTAVPASQVCERVCVCFSHSQKLCREMMDKTTPVPVSQVCERVCVCVSVILRNCAERWRTKLQLYLPARCVSVCVCFSHSQKLCREMKDKTTPVPASQVCERVCVSVILRNCAERWRTKLHLYLSARCVSVCVCVFQSFSETVQRDDGQNYTCTCQPGVWVCVCVFQSFSETVQRDEGQNYSCTCQPGVWACVCVSVILRNCAERWRTKLQLYLPARCVSVCVCVFQSFSETVQRDEGQNYTCTCQPGVWACVCVCFSHSQKLCREMKDKTTAVPASQVCERVCVFQSFSETVQRDEGQNYSCTCQPGVWACVCFSHSQKLCREMKDKTTAVPASQVCERVCVFQSFSETVQRDEGQNYSCTCQPGVWACMSVCVCFSHSQKLCREMTDKTTAVPASQVCERVCVSVILRNCAERWRTKLQLYLPARCVSGCVFQSFSETVQRDEGQNYTCTCQPGVWACVCFSHSQKLCREMKDKTTPVPASQVCERVCVCVSVILRNCAERWRTKLHLYLSARCVSVCVCVFQSFSETVQRDEGQNYTCTCQPGVWACVCFSHSQITVCPLAQWLWWRLQGFDLSCIICMGYHICTPIFIGEVHTTRLNGKNKPFKYIYFFFLLKTPSLNFSFLFLPYF